MCRQKDTSDRRDSRQGGAFGSEVERLCLAGGLPHAVSRSLRALRADHLYMSMHGLLSIRYMSDVAARLGLGRDLDKFGSPPPDKGRSGMPLRVRE